jgi:hypothetical protein
MKYTHEIVGYLKRKGEKEPFKEVKLGLLSKNKVGSYPDIVTSYEWMAENTTDDVQAYCKWQLI